MPANMVFKDEKHVFLAILGHFGLIFRLLNPEVNPYRKKTTYVTIPGKKSITKYS